MRETGKIVSVAILLMAVGGMIGHIVTLKYWIKPLESQVRLMEMKVETYGENEDLRHKEAMYNKMLENIQKKPAGIMEFVK